MNHLLKKYIAEVLSETDNARVPNQLVNQKKPEEENADGDEASEMDEMNVAGNIAGMTGPLGLSNEVLKGPGAGPKKKKSSARWK